MTDRTLTTRPRQRIEKTAKRIRLGLVGLGYPGKEKHWKAELHSSIPSISWSRYLPQIAKNPLADLVAICDRSIQKKNKLVQQAYGRMKLYENYQEMIEEADIDAVIICTPHKLHAQMAIDAANSGKHILVDKPLATSMSEAKKVIRAARQNNVKLMPLPVVDDEFFLRAKALISEGALGKLFMVRGVKSNPAPGHSIWFYRSGGGPVIDLGVYPLSSITALIGSARMVQAFECTIMKERIVRDRTIRVFTEDNAAINLDFGRGLLASIQTNYTNNGLKLDSIEFHGSRGSLLLRKDELALRMFLKEPYHALRGWFEMRINGKPVGEGIVNRFLDCILADKNIDYMGEHQLHVVEIMEKAKISASTGKAIKLTTRFST